MCNNNTNLTAAYLPRNTKYIADHAFANCTNLLSTNISNLSSLISIDDYAFAGCTNLPNKLIIPAGTVNIGKNAFSNCTSLTSIEIPSSVKIIDTNAFVGCSCINSISINQSKESSTINFDNIGIDVYVRDSDGNISGSIITWNQTDSSNQN
jgi:hypothetical protein